MEDDFEKGKTFEEIGDGETELQEFGEMESKNRKVFFWLCIIMEIEMAETRQYFFLAATISFFSFFIGFFIGYVFALHTILSVLPYRNITL
jgi:hypothetical protein